MEYKVVVCLLALSVALVFCDHHGGHIHNHDDEASSNPEETDHEPLLTRSSNCPCGRDYVPMCASDGNTYNNKCLFECRAKILRQKGERLYVVSLGRCDGKD